jgi:predicted nuclease of predicted toxin-antitoxin system
MRLLLDENLSRRLPPFLQLLYPGTSQVVLEGLQRADDAEIWTFAKDNEFVIVTKDSDFHELSLLNGSPPKVIWLRCGNSSKANLIRLLTQKHREIEASLADVDVNCVEIE